MRLLLKKQAPASKKVQALKSLLRSLPCQLMQRILPHESLMPLAKFIPL
jgi:hypothetical protein